MYVVVGHLNTLDMGLTLFLFVSLCAFLLAQRDEASARENSVWMHVAWAAMAGAVLTKGLVGLVIPGATLVIYTLIQRDWRLWQRLHPITGLLLFLVITAPWFLIVSMRNPEFAWFFFVHEHFCAIRPPFISASSPGTTFSRCSSWAGCPGPRS